MSPSRCSGGRSIVSRRGFFRCSSRGELLCFDMSAASQNLERVNDSEHNAAQGSRGL
jgi:hypothetical protein